MALENPLWEQNLAFSARLDRALIEALFTEGVLSTADLAVTQRGAGANMSVDVAVGSAAITGDDQANQGRYLVRSTSVVNVVVGAAPGANSRIDLVVAQVRDASVTGVSNDWTISVIAGVAAGVPAAPAVPNTAIALAEILVATGTAAITNAMITDRRSLTRRSGEAAIGTVEMTAAAAIPSGWLECNGAQVSRTLYAALYAALGGGASPWGQGNGTTTFHLPNLVDKLPQGAGAVALGTTAAQQHLHAKTGGVTATGGISTGGHSADHLHSGTTGGRNAAHGHTVNTVHTHYHPATAPTNFTAETGPENQVITTGTESADHGHGFSTGGVNVGHTHDYNHGHADSIAISNATGYTAVGLRFMIKV